MSKDLLQQALDALLEYDYAKTDKADKLGGAAIYALRIALYQPFYSANYVQPEPTTERNFCARCGKRLGDADHVHTCTPPIAQPEQPAPVIVAPDADSDAMNTLHGEAYGVNWVYPPIAQPEQTTGWPPGMLQDDSRPLSKWLANTPDALRYVHEATPTAAKVEGDAKDAARQVFTVEGMPMRGDIISDTLCDLCGKTWAGHFDVFCFENWDAAIASQKDTQ